MGVKIYRYFKFVIFVILKFLHMKNYERVILNKEGKDIGLREDNRGAIYIDTSLYFKNEKIRATIQKISKSNIVKGKTSK